MCKFFYKIFILLAFCFSFVLAKDSFITLNPAVPNSQNSVIEAFSYKCIHCYHHHKFGTLEKLREAFPNLHFKLYPVSLMNGDFAKEMNELFAFAQYQDEQNGKDASYSDSLTHKLADVYFVSYFLNKQSFSNSNDFYEVGLKAMGVDKNEVSVFLNTTKAKEILNEFQRANDIAKTYGTPAFVVNGKYQINPSAIGSMQDLQNLVKKLSDM
ncbi:thiol:disulfide interchange protein DsbA/DsbL [Campylobacter sp. VTCC 70190]|uniref:thiol:disulfide interchange protein DsbA/DsbL n=1 Tax=Campylobacter sp. VTCC 70190 TaxID=3392118 RepID=UPI00398F13CD